MRIAVYALTIIMLMHVASAFKPESVVIHANPSTSDEIEIYTVKTNATRLLKFLQIESVRVIEKNNHTVLTARAPLDVKTGIFERRIDGKTLETLSSIGDVYIYIDKGCDVTGNVKLIGGNELRNLYRHLGYGDVIYRLKKILYELLAGFLCIPVTLFALSRFHAKRVFLSDLSREEKVYRIRMFVMLLSILSSILILLLLIATNAVAAYDVVIGYFVEYGETEFVIGFISIFLVCYAISIISAVTGYLPYYREIRDEEIKPAKSAKGVAKIIFMLALPMLVWVALIINLPKSMLRTEYLPIIFAAFILAFLSLSPNLLTLIYRAERLENPLREEILSLCRECGVNISDVRVLKGLPERIANAGVSGILRKYLFLTECTVDELTKDEIMAVTAHEIGHLKERHSLINGLLIISFFVIWISIVEFLNLPDLGFYAFSAMLVTTSFGDDVYISALLKLAEINVMKRGTGGIFNVLSLHPSIEERVKRLRKSRDGR